MCPRTGHQPQQPAGRFQYREPLNGRYLPAPSLRLIEVKARIHDDVHQGAATEDVLTCSVEPLVDRRGIRPRPIRLRQLQDGPRHILIVHLECNDRGYQRTCDSEESRNLGERPHSHLHIDRSSQYVEEIAPSGPSVLDQPVEFRPIALPPRCWIKHGGPPEEPSHACFSLFCAVCRIFSSAATCSSK